MTRFARAKGSKSSNERAPEDGTPWEVMKEQLMQSKKEKEEAGKRQEAENQRIANYENFLKEQKVAKRKATWCDFPEDQPKKRLLPLKQPVDSKEVNAAHTQEKSKKKKKKNKVTTETAHIGPVTSSVQSETTHSETGNQQTDKKKKKKNKKKQTVNGHENVPQIENTKESNDAAPKQKKNNKKKQNDNNINTVADTENKHELSVTAQKKKKKNKKKKNVNIPGTENTEESSVAENKSSPSKNNLNPNKVNDYNMKKMKKVKMINGKPARRKEINDKSFQLIINSKEVELVRFDGFPIMKKDAERLTELRNSMIKKGIPKSEVQRTMKLERRRAEKALARIKRDVCYNCRKGGHNLSDCPELKSKIPGVDAAEGVCFKCGSTEHRQFECKVQKADEFRFATCFICREQGHLARQCPDNPKGLYPNGGSCKLCGDVTHLRKDCPTTQGQREDTSLKLGTVESTDNLEDIGQQVKVSNTADTVKKQPKKITF